VGQFDRFVKPLSGAVSTFPVAMSIIAFGKLVGVPGVWVAS
jgi:hypothetical protein